MLILYEKDYIMKRNEKENLTLLFCKLITPKSEYLMLLCENKNITDFSKKII